MFKFNCGLIVSGKFSEFQEAYTSSKEHLQSGKVLSHLKKIQTF